jgi:hypothetical protein
MPADSVIRRLIAFAPAVKLSALFARDREKHIRASHFPSDKIFSGEDGKNVSQFKK